MKFTDEQILEFGKQLIDYVAFVILLAEILSSQKIDVPKT